jgi:hypothetical protein
VLTHCIYGVLGCNGIKRSRLFTFPLYLNLENANSFTHDSRINYHEPNYKFENKMLTLFSNLLKYNVAMVNVMNEAMKRRYTI